jgi:hypothetical protein
MSDDFKISFSSDDKVKGGSIPANTILTVTAIEHDEGNLKPGERIFGKYVRAGKSPKAGKLFFALRFKVSEADDASLVGRPVDSTLWADPTEAKFRAQVEKILNRRLPRPGDAEQFDLDPNEIAEAMGEFSFRVTVGPSNTGYTEVKYYNERLPRVELTQTEIGGADGGDGDSFDDWGDDDGDGDGF